MLQPVHTLPRGRIHVARAEDVYPDMPDGSVELVISDGPYNMRKAAWDRFKSWEHFREWYRPHVEAWGRVCAASATVYLWGTQRSVRELAPVMEAAGWTWGGSIVWDKGDAAATAHHARPQDWRNWKSITETCDVWTRCAIESKSPTGPATMTAYAAGKDERNWMRNWLVGEWVDAGLTRHEMDTACGVKCMASRHYWMRDQWYPPTWERYQQLAAYAAEHGKPHPRGYLVHPDCSDLQSTHEHLRSEYEHLRSKYEHLRAEYEAARRPFSHPIGCGNVWRAPTVAGNRRLKGADGKSLHPCQKPIEFYERIIRASSRPGSLVLEPFGGTCRAAVACEALPDDEARQYICIEPDEDGRGYVPAVLASIGVEEQPAEKEAQPGLFA